MKVEPLWSLDVGTQPVYSLVQTPDGAKMYAATGKTVITFGPGPEITRQTSTQHPLVTCLAISPDGHMVVSMGTDGAVMFNDSTGAALFKYSHQNEVQAAAFSPDGSLFVSAAIGDVGIYHCKDVKTKVMKQSFKGTPRAIAWAPGSNWFVISTQDGDLVMMTPDGLEFNSCNLGAPAWALKVVQCSSFLVQPDNDINVDITNSSDDEFTIPQSVTPSASASGRSGSGKKHKGGVDREEFIMSHNLDSFRILVVSWDMRYRVINPSIYADGACIAKLAADSANTASRSSSRRNLHGFLVAISDLPFIPLCMETIGNYVFLSGVGGSVIVLNSSNGRVLSSLYQVWESDPFISKAPLIPTDPQSKNSSQKKTIMGQVTTCIDANQRLMELRKREAMANRNVKNVTNPLAFHGMHTIWCYSMIHVEPSSLILGLSNGVLLCLSLKYAMVHSQYGNLYTYRKGLMSVSVMNLSTGRESILEIGMHVEKLSIYESTLAIKTSSRLLLYRLQDPALKKRNIESVMDYYGSSAGGLIDTDRSRWQGAPSLCYSFEASIKKRLFCSQLIVTSNHFFLCNVSQISVHDFSGKQTDRWIFKQFKCTYVKSIGGIPDNEAILAGFDSGKVCIFKIGNKFPIELLLHKVPIVSLDISPDRKYISVVDRNDLVSIYKFLDDSEIALGTSTVAMPEPENTSANYSRIAALAHISLDGTLPGITTNQEYSIPLYTFKNTTSATWDLVLPGVLARSTQKSVDICVDSGVSYTFQLSCPGSFVLCQNGNRAFIFNISYLGQSLVNLDYSSLIELVEVPMMPMVIYRTHKVLRMLLDSNYDNTATLPSQTVSYELNEAIKAANLGVPMDCWRDLAIAALFSNELELAREVLATIGDIRSLKAIAEVTRQPSKKTHLLLSALALSMCDHFSEASLLFAASDDIQMATELLFFINRECVPYNSPNSSLISSIAKKLICRELHSSLTGAEEKVLEVLKMQGDSTYSPLGTQTLPGVAKPAQNLVADFSDKLSVKGRTTVNKFLSAIEQGSTKASGSVSDSKDTYSYFNDYRILLRRQISSFAKTDAERTNLLVRHSKFLETSLEWRAAAASYLDMDDPESAIDVLITSKQTGALLRLIRIFPPVARELTHKAPSFNDFEAPGDVDEYAPSSAQNQMLKRAYRKALVYFEKGDDYTSAIFIAQRLGDPLVLLRLLIQQGSWSQVEALGKAYPEMMPSIHEAKATMLLREGRFIEALERLRLSGNTSKEAIIIKQLIDASIAECKFNLTRALTGQLAKQIAKTRAFSALSASSMEYYAAIKAIRARVLVYTGYQQIMEYMLNTLKSRDLSDITMIKLHDNTQSAKIVTAGIFLTGYAAMANELTNADSIFSEELESSADVFFGKDRAKGSARKSKQDKHPTSASAIGFITSSTTPQLGSLAHIDLGLNNMNIPPGISELIVWVCLALASRKTHPEIEARALKRILASRIPGPMIGYFRRQMLLVKGAPSKDFSHRESGSADNRDTCPRCAAQFKAIPQHRPMAIQDMATLASLPHCCPVFSDICKSCGSPIVRSALSLKILPLVLVEPDDETSIAVALERAAAVEMDIEALVGETNRLNIDADDLQTDEGVIDVLRKASIAGDGRGAVLTSEQFEKISPANLFIVDDTWSNPSLLPRFVVGNVIKRFFVRTISDFQLHYCSGCGFFFDGIEYEEYVIVTGSCPICGATNVIL